MVCVWRDGFTECMHTEISHVVVESILSLLQTLYPGPHTSALHYLQQLNMRLYSSLLLQQSLTSFTPTWAGRAVFSCEHYMIRKRPKKDSILHAIQPAMCLLIGVYDSRPMLAVSCLAPSLPLMFEAPKYTSHALKPSLPPSLPLMLLM